MQNVQTTKATRKPAAPKAAPIANVIDKPATETQAAKPAVADTRPIERAVAALAVAEYYTGKSLPFKSASDRFADLRTDKPAKAATTRQAALIAAMLAADTSGNIKPSGDFKRGGFMLPARLFDAKAPADKLVACQPETGCLSDMLGRAVTYISGPTSGKAQADTVLRLNLDIAATEISAQIGDKLAKPALARIAALKAA
jgi:hypothetical protein